MTSDQAVVSEEAVVARPRRSLLGRIGCGMALVLWFTLLLTPCFLGVMLTQGEIRFSTGDAPGQEVRLWLIMEAKERGLGLSTAETVTTDEGVCVKTDIRYFLWAGQPEPTAYCACYVQAGDTFSPIAADDAVCP